MTDTNTLAPADAEILDAAEDFRSQYTHGGTTFDEFDEIGFARAVLAKWGTPAPVGVEPVAWAATSEDGDVEALGMNQSRRFDTPLYAAPQPAAQALDKDEAKAQRLTEKRWLDVGKAVERACIELPEWAEVVLSLEKDAGTVKWFDGDGNEYDSDTHGDCFSETINNAIDAAIAAQQGGNA